MTNNARIKTLAGWAFCTFMYGMHAALAAEGVEAAGGEAHESAGLPQLDVSTFPSQLFWLAVTFVILYIFFSNKALPDLSKIVDGRAAHVQDKLGSADKLTADAEGLKKSYETGLERARAESAQLLGSVREKIQAETAKRTAAFRDRADHESKALESRLNKAKTGAMEDMNTIAAEVAVDAAQRLAGIRMDVDQVRSVLQAINRREAA